MEPASFAVGLVGLAGLSSSGLEVVDRAQLYRSFARDSMVLDAQFDAEKIRLENWARAVGFHEGKLSVNHHPTLDEGEISAVAMKIFNLARNICDAEETRGSRRPSSGLADKGAGLPHSPDAPGKSKRHKLAWALGGESKRTKEVVRLNQFVETLHKLIPVDDVHGSSPNGLLTEIRKLISRLEVETKRDLLAWLQDIHDDRYDDSLQRRLEGTCCWILEQPTFREWISPEFPSGAKLLWIHGPEGFGKTVLCANIVENITKTLPTPVTHFFFSSDLESRDDPTVALRSWLSQVVTQHDGAFQYVLQRRQADLDPIATCSTIASLFRNIVRLAAGVTFVVDGLDECTRLEGPNSVASFLETLTAATAGTDTRVLVVSRSLATIRHALKSNDQTAFSEFRIRSDDVTSDIVAFSRDIVDRLLPEKTDEIRSSLSEAMAKGCEGQFLWLDLLQRNSLRSTMGKKQLQRAVENTPAELDRVYDRSWKTITRLGEADRQRAFALLRWTAFALRPLTTSEITEAVIIEDAEELPWEDLPDDVDEKYVDQEIVSLCSPLLEIRGAPSTLMPSQRTVHLPHFTARRYLLRNLSEPDNLRSNASLAELQHTLLAKACLQYIKYPAVWQIAPADSLVPFGAFRSYAATSWHRHVNLGSRGNAEITRLAVEFLMENSPASEAWRSFVELDDTKPPSWPTQTSRPSPLHYSVKFQLMEVATALIDRQSCDINETTSLGRSALSIACSEGFFKMAEMLLKKGANASLADKEGLMPIHLAAQNGHVEVVRLLLEASTNNARMQMSSAEQGAATDVFDVSFKTPLHHSVLHDQTRCAQLLLEQGAKLTCDIDNMTPLHYAVSKTREEMAQCFLDAGVPIDIRAKRHAWRPGHREGKLHYTRTKDGVHDSRPDIENQAGLTALHYAALIGSPRMTKFLLDHGADPNAVSEHGETPLHLALKRDVHGPRWPDFIDHWSDPFQRIEGILYTIGYERDDEARYSELGDVVEKHRAAVVSLLLDNGSVDVSAADIYGTSPLHNVRYESSAAPEIVQRLIEKGADISARNVHGQTPLHMACSKGNKQAATIILNYGADIMISDLKGVNALHYAAQRGDMETIQHLFACVDGVDTGGFTSSRDHRGQNALHHLLRYPGVVDYGTVACLLDKGININDLDDAGMSPLALYLDEDFALWDDAPPVVRLILESGANPLFKTPDGGLGLAHLHVNSCRVNTEVLVVLADCGVDLRAEDDNGRTVLHHCAIAGSLTKEAFHFLCDKVGLARESLDGFGKTPGQCAAEKRKEERHPDTFDRDRWLRTENILLGLA